MKHPFRNSLLGLMTLLVLGAMVLGLMFFFEIPIDLPMGLGNAITIELTDYQRPNEEPSTLVDDRIEDKKTKFDPSLVDRRPLDGWELNASEAVIRLDVPMVRPDLDNELLTLHPSYLKAVQNTTATVLPSVNMIDGKAKQFDDGLYAAIDQAYYHGRGESMKGHLPLIRRIFEKVARPSVASDYLAAGLSLRAEPVEVSPKAKALVGSFLKQEVWSKPSGFYTWNQTLAECFRVLRFFAMPIEDSAITTELARVFREDKALRDDYVKAYRFYSRLSNPKVGRTPDDLIDGPPIAPRDQFSLFPPSTTRESELFEKLFPNGLPADASMMKEMIRAIRSGQIDLKPGPSSGWYDYQVHALETLLLPDRGEEAGKLLLSRSYKKRMLEAFEALITKRRETHLRQEAAVKTSEAPPELSTVEPRLRVEPNPTYYLRTARSYAFLLDFLSKALGESTLKSLRGLRESGGREMDLGAELRWMRDLFFGLAFLSAEDIGLDIQVWEGEVEDRTAAEEIARRWLAKIKEDADLAVDTRVSVPVIYQPSSGQVRLWVTCGVRLTRLEVQYVRPPSLRPQGSSEPWKPVEPSKLAEKTFLIPVDEFAEVELQGGRIFNRAELRAVCDRFKTRAKIVEALQR